MILFNSWEDIWRILLVGVLAYLSLVAFLRISGKRTLSKLNAFDLVVTVALGSTLATILLSREVSLAEGLVALGLLVALQYVIAWSAARWEPVSKFIKSEPALVLYKGDMLPSAMRRQRVTRSEILQVLRSQGIDSIGEVDSVVLETDGSFSVIRQISAESGSTMDNVSGKGVER